MPHPTYFNLPDDKRARVLAALKAEFAAHPYPRASVDRVTAAAGVSKGSFYQYFVDKRDSYTYLVSELMARRLAVADAPIPEASFEEVLTAMVLGSQELHRRDPQAWAVLARALADDAPDVLATGEALPGGVRAWAHAALAAGQASGELRADVSPQTAAWLIERTLLGLPEHLMRRLAIDPQEVVASGSVFDTPEVRQVAHEVISMLTAALVVRVQDEGLGPGAAGEADHD